MFRDLVVEELVKARSKHKPIHSVHEGYSLILEEVDEFWEEVRKKAAKRTAAALLAELVQIAALAQKTAEDLGLLP